MVVYFQLNVKKGQFEVTDVGGELERGMEIKDIIDKIIQFKATTLCGSDYVIKFLRMAYANLPQWAFLH